MNINDDILYKIDSEIGKDKKVVELQREIERLNQEIRCLNNCIIEFHSEFCNKQAEINRLNNIINKKEQFLGDNIKRLEREVVKRDNIINELEKGIKENIEELEEHQLSRDRIDEDKEILRFLQELKGDDKND